MDIKEFSSLIEKYKRGECSQHEKMLLESYLESFQNNQAEWLEEEMGNKIKTEEKIYSEIMKNIHKENNSYIKRMFNSPELLRRAASIIFFLILVSGILYVSGVFHQRRESVVWYEKITLPGEKYLITLSDGSRITLNAGSKLRYPDEFDEKTREVYLTGEAYFEIHHNTNQPFILHTEELSTTVLGTRFNVSAYPENKTITVSLLEGKVKILRSQRGKVNNLLAVLRPKEQLFFDKEKEISALELFDSSKAVGWKDSIYKFEDEPLHNVLVQLEKAFGVKFKISSQSVLEQRITIKFEKSTIETVIEAIKSLTGLDYKIVKGDKDVIKEVVYFKKANKK